MAVIAKIKRGNVYYPGNKSLTGSFSRARVAEDPAGGVFFPLVGYPVRVMVMPERIVIGREITDANGGVTFNNLPSGKQLGVLMGRVQLPDTSWVEGRFIDNLYAS